MTDYLTLAERLDDAAPRVGWYDASGKWVEGGDILRVSAVALREAAGSVMSAASVARHASERADRAETDLAKVREALGAMLDEHCPLGEHENGEVEYCQRPACVAAQRILIDVRAPFFPLAADGGECSLPCVLPRGHADECSTAADGGEKGAAPQDTPQDTPQVVWRIGASLMPTPDELAAAPLDGKRIRFESGVAHPTNDRSDECKKCEGLGATRDAEFNDQWCRACRGTGRAEAVNGAAE